MIFFKINFTKFKGYGMESPRKIVEKLFLGEWNDSVQYGNILQLNLK